MDDPFLYTRPEPEPTPSSNVGYIVVIVIFLLLAIGLGIWLIILYATGNVGKSSKNANGKGVDRVLILPNARITASSTSVSGSWGTLNSETDVVTLYVSEKPFTFTATGTVIDTGTQKASKAGSGGNVSITTPITVNTSYNAMLVVTGDDTVHYQIYGPIKVYTQDQSNLINRIFNIGNLNTCIGAISNTGNYTTITKDVGSFRLGTADTTSNTSITQSFLVSYDTSTTSETDTILCRIPNTANTSLLRWKNKGMNGTPIICGFNTSETDCENLTATQIDPNLCQWSYNQAPPIINNVSAAGENKWCLQVTQSLDTTNAGNKQILCLARNGPDISVVSAPTADQWFNSFYDTTVVTLP